MATPGVSFGLINRYDMGRRVWNNGLLLILGVFVVTPVAFPLPKLFGSLSANPGP